MRAVRAGVNWRKSDWQQKQRQAGTCGGQAATSGNKQQQSAVDAIATSKIVTARCAAVLAAHGGVRGGLHRPDERFVDVRRLADLDGAALRVAVVADGHDIAALRDRDEHERPARLRRE